MSGNSQSISHFPKPTAQAMLLPEGAISKSAFPQPLPSERVGALVSPSTISPTYSQVLGSNSLHLQRDILGQHEPCPHCSQLWLAHSECIFVTGNGTQERKELHSSFQELKSHIQGHWLLSSTPCSVCQDYFFYHLLTLQLLQNVNLQDLRSGQIKMALRQEVMELRKHVRENHMGK